LNPTKKKIYEIRFANNNFSLNGKGQKRMKNIVFLFLFIFTTASFAGGDFITEFLNTCVEAKMPVNNVNIGRPMLEKMASNTNDEEVKKTFQNLNSIRIITTENKKDARHYFKKANELIADKFSDYEEVVSVNDKNTKINVVMKNKDNKNQDIIFIGLDDEGKLTIINIAGKIDFHAISKLSDSLNKEMDAEEDPSKEDKPTVSKQQE
jgi:hypothetical protein